MRLRDFLRCHYTPTESEKFVVRHNCRRRRRPFSPLAIFIVSSGFGLGFEASSINLLDNRSFRAVSAGPKTLDRNFDLFALFRLDLRPLAIPISVVGLYTSSAGVCSVWEDSVLLLWYRNGMGGKVFFLICSRRTTLETS